VVERAAAGEAGHYIYSRYANPTVAAFENAIAALEGAEAAVATSSGMGAISAALMALVKAGDGVATTSALYGNTRGLLDQQFAGLGVQVHHHDPAALEAGLPPGTRVLFTESISNPLLAVADVARLAEIARAAGARLVVDNTFATPYHLRPLEHGADLVIHSATKYLGGHGDLMAGVAAGGADVIARVRSNMRALGTNAAPFDAWLALRGLRTLHLRMARHAANARAVAEYLAGHPKVVAVHYPGLPAHPDHAVARRLLRDGFGGMVSFELAGALAADGHASFERLLSGFRMIRFAASLADVSTTVSYPVATSHRGQSSADLAAQGITDRLVRLSCGIEAAGDIIADLERGLGAV